MAGDPDVERWRSAGLYDPSAGNAADRLALLAYLRDRGATLEQMREAHRVGNLAGVAGDLARTGGQLRITARELAARSGVSLDDLSRISRAAGLTEPDPDKPVYLEDDVEAFRTFTIGAEFFGLESAIQFGRVIGAAMASVADGAVSEFGQDVRPRLDEAQANQLEQAKAVEFASALLVEQVPTVLLTMFRHHVDAAVRRSQLTGGQAATADLAVGFLDLVGSTALGERLEPEELGGALSEFERDATGLVAERGGRLVKTIGDEVMFVTTSAGDACEVALGLTEHVERHPVLPSLRGGLATGGLVRGYGDFYGPVVNVAARIVKHAEPGRVLVTDAVRREADDSDASALSFTAAGEYELRGIDGPVEVFLLERG